MSPCVRCHACFYCPASYLFEEEGLKRAKMIIGRRIVLHPIDERRRHAGNGAKVNPSDAPAQPIKRAKKAKAPPRAPTKKAPRSKPVPIED